MRDERSQRRERTGQASFRMESADRSGKRVAEVENVSVAFDGKPVIRNFSTLVTRGDRIGIVGANGAGKTTLLKLLLGELEPDSGTVTLGTKLEVAYFDQLRAHLDPEKNQLAHRFLSAASGGQDFIEINGRKRHAISYLGDFLFTPDRVRTPVKALSGGEQNRAILARLFSKPANLLVLDEPTNDLDVETLELLEEILMDYKGTVLLVSHDRAFMDNVVTSIIVLEGDGRVSEHVGGYSDWVAKGGRLVGLDEPAPEKKSASSPEPAPAPKPAAKKLSYKDQRELDALPDRIEALEAKQAELEAAISAPGFYEQDHAVTSATLEELAEVQVNLEAAFARWEELGG